MFSDNFRRGEGKGKGKNRLESRFETCRYWLEGVSSRQ